MPAAQPAPQTPTGLGSLLLTDSPRPHVLFPQRIALQLPGSPLEAGLLSDAASESSGSESGPPFVRERLVDVEEYPGTALTLRQLGKEVSKQARVSAPLAADLVLTHSLTLISLAYVAQLGTRPMAAAALAAASYTMLGRLIISGLCGALDTQAAQAYGAGDVESCPAITQRAVLFSLLHCLPLTGLLCAVPYILEAMGVQPVLCHMMRPYLLILLPRLWFEAVQRPVYGCLFAQRIAAPQMAITAVVTVVHVGLCYLLMYGASLGYLGAAVATTTSSYINMLLTLVYVHMDHLIERTWGRLTSDSLKGWRQYARLAYAACAMKVLEAWSAGSTILLATLLPHSEAAVASITVACDLYTVLSMPFVAGGMAACARVGAALGAGQAVSAQLAARASLLGVPLLWLLLAALLLEPHSQSTVLWLFTKGDDLELVRRLQHLLDLVVIMVLLTGFQATFAGILQGMAKQAKGAYVNLFAFWIIGLPLGAYFAFGKHWGVQGLLAGLITGPLLQTASYAFIIAFRLNWKSEAFKAWGRISLGHWNTDAP